ncbi:hypothetical protein ACTHAM_001067 [Cellulomonas soli]|uniref:hypothetical protein n=1 Tax=Cellulomonas soli TaxID=931535 RepID=UPI003F86E95E
MRDRVLRAILLVAAVVSLGAVGRLVLDTATGEAGTWVLGRAGGVASYVLLLALVVTGLLQAHPWARGLRHPSPSARLAVHVSLATFTLAFTTLHVVVLALDPWAHVGWAGALLPMASGYRPVAVTLGLLGLWSGLLTGVTARLAGRFAARIWWPVHKVAAGSFVLVWAHSVLAGSDVSALRVLYASTGLGVLALAVTRYGARTSTDRVRELVGELRTSGGLR